MPPAGDETTLALWREVGEWWTGEAPREVRRFIDATGVRREDVRVQSESNPEGVKEHSEGLPAKRATLVTRATGEPYPEGVPETNESGAGSPQSIGLAVGKPPEIRIRRLKDEKIALALGYGKEPDLSHLRSAPKMAGAALHALSGYAFGRATMFAAEIPAMAAERGYTAALLADRFSLAGAMEFVQTAKKVGIHPMIGATVELDIGGELVLVARNKDGYRSLSRLITECHLDEPRLYPLATFDRISRHAAGLLCLSGGDGGMVNRRLLQGDLDGAAATLDRLIGLFGRENVFVEIERSFLPWEIALNRRLLELAESRGVVPVAGGAILYAHPDHFPAQDTLVCIESLCLIEEVLGRKPPRDPTQPQVTYPPQRGLNAERYFRSLPELGMRFADHPDMVRNTMQVAERCSPDVLPHRTQLPPIADNEPEALREVALTGMLARYPRISRKLRKRIDDELERIIRLDYSGHFLVAWDMCDWAKQQGILWSGRGSVVDSVVAYCLGLSRIDAFEHNLFFDRFLPADGSKRPDIDIDFEAKYRDDVRNYLAKKYGERHVATVAAFGTYGTRGIVREVGKVMGIPEESLGYLAKRLHGSVSAERLDEEIDAKPELRNSNIPRERFRWVFRLAETMTDLPRNARAHSSGVVISRDPICDTVPVQHSGIEDVKIIQWDKRSAKRCFDKFDVLCLRGNDVLGNTQRQIRTEDPSFDVVKLPLDDDETFRTMRAGKLIGVPQSASPAMRQAHMRIKTANLKDAAIVQAGIRPGVGGAVKLNELIARRHGKPYSFSHPILRQILEPTYGIVVFQEQIDRLLQDFGGYTSDEAEEIREAIHKQRRDQYVERIHTQVIGKIRANGFSPEVAQDVYEHVAVFQGYGFAEGHALAFAEISIRSIWCQQNFPAEYFSALLDAQPAGYYGPCTLANEARIRGVKVLPPDVNRSGLGFTVEDVLSEEDPKLIFPKGGIRTSLRQISGIAEETRERIVARRMDGPFASFYEFVARVTPPRDELERLVLCGALDPLWPNRRAMLWAIPQAYEHAVMIASMAGALPLLLIEPEMPRGVADFTVAEKAIRERLILDMDVERHLMAFERPRVLARGGRTAAEASVMRENEKAFVVGNPIRLRFPPTSSGRRVMFFDLEDESGLLNVTCFDDVYQRDGHTVICSPYVTLWGTAQHRDDHVAFLAQRIYPFRPSLDKQIRESEGVPVGVGDFLMK
jgi:error-prone DNA polymerase